MVETISKRVPALLCSLLFPLSASADGTWYLGGSFGTANTDVDAATLNTRLRNEGLPGTASVSDTSRPGWRLFGGYAWNDYLGAEVGYTGLGDIKMSLSGTGPVTATQLKAIRPATGSGVEVAVLGKYPLTERLNGFVRSGLFHWEQLLTRQRLRFQARN